MSDRDDALARLDESRRKVATGEVVAFAVAYVTRDLGFGSVFSCESQAGARAVLHGSLAYALHASATALDGASNTYESRPSLAVVVRDDEPG